MADVIMDSGSKNEATKIQQQILNNFARLSKEERIMLLDHLNSVRDGGGIELISVQETHSLRLYFHISTVEALRAVRQLFDSGQLKSIVESLFNFLLTDTHFEPVRVKLLSLVNYCHCEHYLNRGELVSSCCL